MSAVLRRAAQYVRMSSDRQELSPLIQKDAIGAYAVAHGIEIVATYEDDGRSGVHLKNRAGMRKLLSDVGGGAEFSEILVYDVSRWGRFQDVDAAAYHEYYCRSHGVQVVFVNEAFDNDQKPTTVLLKSMKRVMAAEYSRELAHKTRAGQLRVISMGFHMGPLPPLGYRRCSVSADGARRVPLGHGQLKLALTDRIEWILGPEREVALVRRICKSYLEGFELDQIASLVRSGGWLTVKGRPMTAQSLRILLNHEALIGNFVWGAKSSGGKILESRPTRMNGSVPRILDDTTWNEIQERLGADTVEAQRQAATNSESERRVGRRPLQLQLAFVEEAKVESYRRGLGSVQQLRNHTREFGRALRTALEEEGLSAAFDTRWNVLSFWSARVRLRLMWPTTEDAWILERTRSVQSVKYILVARMWALYQARDFFVVPSSESHAINARQLGNEVPEDLLPYWCARSDHLVKRLRKISAS